jgi:O-antigen ligase
MSNRVTSAVQPSVLNAEAAEIDEHAGSSPFESRIIWIGLLGFIAICLMTGGSSRADAQSQIVVRLAAVLLGAVVVGAGRLSRLFSDRPLIIIALAWLILISCQLIPLPPALWQSLPGRAVFSEAAMVAGIAQPWRPISITPDLTLTSLVALFPAAAALLATAQLRAKQFNWVLGAFLMGAVTSALVGIAQLAGGQNSALYTYAISSLGSPVGLFANRNHHALFLGCAIPMAMLFATSPHVKLPTPRIRLWIGIGCVLLFLVLIVVSGSRSGLGFGIGGLAAGLALCRDRLRAWKINDKRTKWVLGLSGAAFVAFVAALFFNAKMASISRIVQGSDVDDLRVSNLPYTMALAKQYFPFGSGFGSFDPAYRVIEPDRALAPTYYNHAHNDLVELAISSGAFGLMILCAFLVWWIALSRRIWRRETTASLPLDFARLGSVIILMIFAASLVDYPLRTAIISVLFAVATIWLSRGAARLDCFTRTGGMVKDASPAT